MKPGSKPRRYPERDEERRGSRLWLAVGGEVVNFSQSRKTMQTEGIPDRKLYHRPLGLTVWWEVKAPGGKQSPKQKNFQAMAEACGERYIIGPAKVVEALLLEVGLARMVLGQFTLKPYFRPNIEPTGVAQG